MDKSKNLNNKRRNRIFVRTYIFYLILITIITLTVLGLIMPDKKFSNNENRNLQNFPEPTIDKVINGKYFSEVDKYLSDQFIGRNTWISIDFFVNRLIGKKEAAGVYFGKKEYLFDKPVIPDDEAIEKSVNSIKKFAKNHPDININFAIVPCSGAILTEYLPANAPIRNQLADISKVYDSLFDTEIKLADISKLFMEHKDEELYYHTDHHWTTLGSYYAFKTINANLGNEDSVEAYTHYTVSKAFKGTLASKVGNVKYEDTIEIFVPDNIVENYYVSYPDSNITRASVYDSSKLKEKDQYQVFLGGNFPYIEISTANDTEKTILIFKDSYANSFVPFLLHYYDTIILIDPRYYYGEVDTLLASRTINDVLFLYSANTFLTDNMLALVLGD